MVKISTKFAIDNYDMSQLGVYIGSPNNGLLEGGAVLDLENIIEPVPSYDGGYFYEERKKPRIIEIPCYFENITELDKRNILQKLNFKIPKKFQFDGIPYMQIYGKPNRAVKFNYMDYGDTYSGWFVYEIVCPSVYFKSTNSSLEGFNYYEDSAPFGSFAYDAGLPYIEDLVDAEFTNITTDQNVIIENLGNAPCKTKISIIGDCTSLTINNTTSEESFTISSLTNEDIVIDGNRGIITESTESVLKTSLFSGSFINISPGENTISISSTSMNLLSITFLFYHTFI